MDRRRLLKLTALSPLAAFIAPELRQDGDTASSDGIRPHGPSPENGRRNVPCVGAVDEAEYWRNHERYCTLENCPYL